MQFHCDLKTYMQTIKKKKKPGEINDNKRATIIFFQFKHVSLVLQRTIGSTQQYVNIINV